MVEIDLEQETKIGGRFWRRATSKKNTRLLVNGKLIGNFVPVQELRAWEDALDQALARAALAEARVKGLRPFPLHKKTASKTAKRNPKP